jgi:ribosome-binding factor A
MARQPHSSEDPSVRLLKVGERVRHVLSEILTRQQVHDETLSAHTVSVSEEAGVLKALRQNTAYLQREVAQRLGLKFAPKLKFMADESFEEADRIEQLLSDPRVARDLDQED